MSPAPETLRETETGYLRTRLVRQGDQLDLVRSPGPLRAQVDPLPAATVTRLARLRVDGVIWVVPEDVGDDGHRYPVPGTASAAALALAGIPAAGLARMLAPVGTALAAVHSVEPVEPLPLPNGLRRLHAWLTDGSGPGEAEQLHTCLADVPALAQAVTSWSQQLAESTAGCTTGLGAPGMATAYPVPDGSATHLLLTEELALARPEWDLGWLLGERLELVNHPELTPTPVTLADDPVARAVIDAYPGPLDTEMLRRTCLLRWVIHLHDYASYVGWAPDIPVRLARIAALAEGPDLLPQVGTED